MGFMTEKVLKPSLAVYTVGRCCLRYHALAALVQVE